MTMVATRANTGWLTWSGVKAAMASLNVQVHSTKEGFVVSMPDPKRAGESATVATKLSSNRASAERLVDVINSAFGATLAGSKPPACSVKACQRDGSWPAGGYPIQLICDHHSGHKY